ncbi:MAG: cysteine peptidase family C39 domain-containing protein [Candidatus Absconditicoccaceae bacterium]
MKILNFPERRQTYNYDCGACALQSVLNYYGIDVREDIIMKLANTTKDGTPIGGIERTSHKYGLQTTIEHMTISKIKKYVDQNIPVIVVLQARSDKKHIDWENDWVDGHYVVAIGYDKDKLYFEDPSSIYRTYLLNQEFKNRRHDVDINNKEYIHYGIVIYGKKPKYSLKSRIHMD